MHRRRLLLSFAMVASSIFAVTGPAGVYPARADSPPNIVLILTDDMRWDELERMPYVHSDLIDHGMQFDDAFVVNSLCCPSRSTILTGKYSHSTGVWTNSTSHGGFAAFGSQDRSTIATWLHDAGYETALIGKYLNGYSSKMVSYIPPGWDDWIPFLQPPNYYNYSLGVNGVAVRYGSTAADYSTDVLDSDANAFIRNTPAEQPLFLEYAPYAPHAPFTPAPRYLNALPNFTGIRPPNLNEADVSDKPAWVQALPLGKGTWDSKRKEQEQTLLSVDDAVHDIVTSLSDTGRLDNTLIMFMSDNGLSGGSHRWTAKEVGWDEAIRTPMIVRYDALLGGVASHDTHVVANIDVAPTFAAAAGVSTPTVDGISLMPLLTGTATNWRSEIGIEHFGGKAFDTSGQVPSYCGVRTDRWKYIEYATHEEELYDLWADPYELQSLDKDPAYADVKASLHADMLTLCSPPPPGMTP